MEEEKCRTSHTHTIVYCGMSSGGMQVGLGLWEKADGALVAAAKSAEKIRDISGLGLSLSVLSWSRYVHGSKLAESLEDAQALYDLGVAQALATYCD